MLHVYLSAAVVPRRLTTVTVLLLLLLLAVTVPAALSALLAGGLLADPALGLPVGLRQPVCGQFLEDLLLQVARLRVLAGQIGLTQVAQTPEGIRLSGAVWTDVIDPAEAPPKGVRRIVVDSATSARILMAEISTLARLAITVELTKRWAQQTHTQAGAEAVAL